MADTVTSKTLLDSGSRLVVHLTGVSDATGETNVVKVDKSALTVSGAEPSKVSIQTIRWNVQGYLGIKLSWDRTTDETAMILSSNGYEDFREFGGLIGANTGDTGDLLLSSIGAVANATYDITIELKKE